MVNKKILIQIYSDIHIENWNKLPIIPIKAKYLFLAGDICCFKHHLFYKFFDYCSANWEKVFYVPGNHEFYDNKKSYNELCFDYKYNLSKKYKNVFYLDNEIINLDENINVYGSTFWTKSPFFSKIQAKNSINDYNNIKYFNEDKNGIMDWDTNFVNKLSNIAFQKLSDYLLVNNSKLTIILTHFPPIRSETSHPKYLKSSRIENQYFSWEDETIDKLNLKNVPLWISGHTHWSYNLERNNTNFISNQLGYNNEIGNTGFKEDGLYELDFTF